MFKIPLKRELKNNVDSKGREEQEEGINSNRIKGREEAGKERRAISSDGVVEKEEIIDIHKIEDRKEGKREVINSNRVSRREEEETKNIEEKKRGEVISTQTHPTPNPNRNIYSPNNQRHISSNPYKTPLMLFTFLILTLSFILVTSYSLQHVDYRKAWIPLHQIALSYMNPITIDQNNNNKIDTQYLEVSLQNITDVYGLTSTGTLNIGGINSLGPIISSGNLNIGAGKLFVDVSTGNVGIGTTSPSYKLDVNGNAYISGDLSLDSTITGANRFSLSFPTTGVYDDSTINSPYSRINADSFHTNGLGVGQIYIEGRAIDANTYIAIGAGLAGGQSPQDVMIGDNNEIYVDTSANSVGIGTTSPSYKLDVNGDTRVNGSIIANEFLYPSDMKIKTNIYELNNSLDIILQLKPVKYQLIYDSKERYGLIAQELEKILPSVVYNTSNNNLKTIDYIQLIPLLIQAIKEQQKEIEYLKKKVEIDVE